MHSLINIVPRKHSNGEPYFQTRFFDKNRRYIKTASFPETQSRAEAYFSARKILEEILISAVLPKEEIERYGILSIDEVKKIMALPVKNQNDARNILIALLGITCGLGVSEIRYLKREHIKPNDMFMIETSLGNRSIPFFYYVRGLLISMNRFIPDSRFVIPNLSSNEKTMRSDHVPYQGRLLCEILP